MYHTGYKIFTIVSSSHAWVGVLGLLGVSEKSI